MDAIAEIYDAVGDEAAFARLPDAIARAANARSAIIQQFDHNWDLQSVDLSYFPRDMLARYLDIELWRLDPWKGPAIASMERLVDMELVAPATEIVRSEFYRENFHHWGDDTAQCLGGAFATRDGFIGIGLHRGYCATTFSDSEYAGAREVVPHVLRLFDLRGRLQSAGRRAALSEAALNAQPNAVFIVDQNGRPHLMNAAAEELAAQSDGMQLTKVGLRASKASEGPLLMLAIKSACARTGAHGGSFRLSRPNRMALRVTVSPFSAGERTMALVVANDPAKSDPAIVTALRGLYDMTPAEAETAASLARGLAPAQIACARRVSLATTRSQIRQVLLKTEARGLAEVASLVASAPTTPAGLHPG